ncbi:porin [Polaromonas hydrogenivorans]|uniref:Porin n=1 Tax=Polaromonas hydrogenivorans TaxID=335476 RepID=A0AAU7LVY8_9BURK
MKKSLIALAVVAASGAAMAQSSVTLYGIADASFGVVKNGTVTQTKIDSGLLNTSRFGFKGTEDLGGGLKASFLLEQGFNVDNGASLEDSQDGQTKLNQMFSRNAYVGLSGGFGEVRLGKVWSAFDEMKGASNAAWDSGLSPNSGVFYGGAIGGYTYNPRNSAIYFTPNVSGFSGAASYSMGENKTATVNAGRVAALNVKYTGGPLYVGLGHQTERVNGSVPTKKFTMLNATYDFGMATLQASVGRQSQNDLKTRDWTLGATVPVSGLLSVSGGFAGSTDNVAAGDIKRKGISLAAQYALSKRTFLYTGYHATRTTYPVLPRLNTSLYAMGVSHLF